MVGQRWRGTGSVRAIGCGGGGPWLVGALGLCGWLLAAAAGARTFHAGGYRFDVDPPPAWVDVLPAPTRWTDTDGTQGEIWRNWVWDDQIDRRHGGRSQYTDYVYQPMTAEVVADASRYEIGFLPDFEKLTIHRVEVLRDGQWSNRLKPETITLARREARFESDMATGEVTALLVLEDIRVGDVIRISYTIDGDNPVLAGLGADATTLGGRHALQYERYRVTFDPGAKVQVDRDPRIPAEQVADLADGKRITIQAHDLKPISTRGNYPAWFYPAPMVTIVQRHTWKEIADWARGLYPTPKPLPEDLQGLIAQWAKLPDPEQRVVHALEAVQDQVRYFGLEIGQNSHRPAEPADVWRRREGDCKDKARLLVTILGELGIKAEPALVSTKGGDWVRRHPPAATAFDHVIVRAHLGSREVWLDPTRNLQRGSLDQHTVSNLGDALPLAPGADALVAVVQTPAATSRWRVEESYTPDADGKHVRMQVVTDASDAAAETLRRRIANTDRTALQDKYRDFYAKRFKEVRVAAPLQVRDDTASDHVILTETYTLDDPWSSLGDGVRGLETQADGVAPFIDLPDGQGNGYPIAIGYPVDVEQKMVLNLPRGWSWGGKPIHESVDVPGMDYSLTTGQKDAQVSFEHVYRSTAAWVDAEHAGPYRDGLRKVKDLASRRFLVSRGGAERRDDRLHQLVDGLLDSPPSPAPTGKEP